VIHQSILWTSLLSGFIPIIIGLLVYTKLNPPYKILFGFLCIAVIADIIAKQFGQYYGNNMPILHIFTPIETCAYLLVFRGLKDNSILVIKSLNIAIGVTLVLSLIDAFFWGGIWEYNALSRSTEGLMLVAFSLNRLYFLLNQPYKANFFKQPQIWMLFGILIYFSSSFIFFTLPHGVLQTPISKLSHEIHAIMNIFCNLLFAYSYLCHRNQTR
jgi:hypothetical protein